MPTLGKIYKWIQANKGLFQQTPVGPIIVELEPKNYSEELWLQQHVATNTALRSFIVQGKADYDALYHHVREVQGHPISIISGRNGSERAGDDSELIAETLRSQVDPNDIDQEAGLYGTMALLRFFEEDSQDPEPEESDDDDAEYGLRLKKHNN